VKGGIFLLGKYSKKKEGNQGVAPYIENYLSPGGYKQFIECGNWLEMKTDKDVTKMKLNRANFCNNRFCPMCAWRLAKKDALRVSTMIDYIEAEHDMAFIMVTLTAPNVGRERLNDEITRYNKAFKNMVLRDSIKRINQGYIRKMEVTYNKKRNDYHPHFHCVFAVKKTYFKDRSYLSQEKWLGLWREAMDDDSITQVDVRRMTKLPYQLESGVREVAKYMAKDKDYTHNQEVFDTFYTALKGRQVMTYNGLFTEANKLYKAKKLDNYKAIDKTEYYWLIIYNWGGKGYLERARKEMAIEDYWPDMPKLTMIEELPMDW
jgi:plasmid rolling circle replication initiator protein Rep